MQLITTVQDFGNLLNDLEASSRIYLDIESTGLDYYISRLIMIQLQANENNYVFDCTKMSDKDITYLVSLIDGCNKPVVGHNIKFDAEFLYVKTGILIRRLYDTMLIDEVINNGKTRKKYASLADLVYKYCGIILDKTVREQFYTTFTELTEEQINYGVEDINYLPKIYESQQELIKSAKLGKVVELENRLLTVVCDMEITGILLDIEGWRRLANSALDKANAAYTGLREVIAETVLENKTFSNVLEAADFMKIPVRRKSLRATLEKITDLSTCKTWIMENININSPTQMKVLLRDVMGLEIESTDAKELEAISNPPQVIRNLLDYRAVSKLATTYGENIIDKINSHTGRLHTSFNQLGTNTGRFSSDGPNLQNIPRSAEYRASFIAAPGKKYVCADYSQIEYKLAGSLTGEPAIINSYLAGKDMHTATASFVFDTPLTEVTKEQRTNAKPYNYSMLYGANEFGMSYSLGITVDKALTILEGFRKNYPVFSKFKDMYVSAVIKHKYAVTPLGRRRYFEDKTFFTGGWKEEKRYNRMLEKEGFNTYIQGCAGDIMKDALCRMWYNNPFGNRFKILLTVHDEVVCEVDEDIAEAAKDFVVECMEDAEKIYLKGIPAGVSFDIGEHWIH